MTIYKDDIKLFESKVMTDAEDGGGAMTDQEIISGEHNSIFPDISDLDRAYGVVGIRSVHLKVDADTNETYFGATVGLSDTPTDEMVEVTLMSVNDPYIEREKTKELIEQYLTAGAKYDGELFYNHIKGQRTLKIMQRTSRATPNAGDVLVVADLVNDEKQYCRLTAVSSQVTDFEMINVGEFDLRIVTCEISEPLRFNFTGSSPSPYMTPSTNSRIYGVSVADASKYYGAKRLIEHGEFASSSVKVDGIYNQLVPSARVDNAVTNESISQLVDAVAYIDEAETIMTEISMYLESQSLAIDIDNQGYVYVQTLIPTPSPKTLTVYYMAQGNWYTLSEDGTGVLKGEDEAHGAGTLDELGNLTITTGGLPDIDSEIIMQWGSVNTKSNLASGVNFSLESGVNYTASSIPNNSSMNFTWGEDKTATCVNGIISGDATGTVKNSYINFIPNELPAPNTIISATWEENPAGVDIVEDTQENVEVSAGETQVPAEYTDSGVVETDVAYLLTVPANKTPKVMTFKVTPADYEVTDGRSNYTTQYNNIYLNFDPSNAYVYTTFYKTTYGSAIGTRVKVGSYNKLTGEVAIYKHLLKRTFVHRTWAQKESFYGGWTVVNINSGQYNVLIVDNDDPSIKPTETVSITTTSSVPAVIAKSIPIESGSFNITYKQCSIAIDLTNTELVKDTLVLTINDRNYEVIGDVVKVGDTTVGTYSEVDQSITLTDWATGNDDLLVKSGLFKDLSKAYLQEAIFITAGNPIASRSLQINAIDSNDVHQLGTADENGIITGGGFTGFINNELGIVKLVNENLVEAGDIKYNAVYYNYLPLNADLLGLDPVRLPSDGRVVIYEKGDIVVIYQENEDEITVSAGDTVQLEVRLATCTTTAPDAVIDLDAGTVYFPTAGTFNIEYRFEDMALLTYVDISGTVKLSKPLSHNYDLTKSKMASLLIAGNLYARYTNLFDQSSWTGVFNDELIGSEATVQFNDTLYPIVVTNDGCITERLAIVFTSSTKFKLIGENIGQIAIGDVNTDFAPINPVSNKPYFILNHLGWGDGWSTNNVLRFDTYGAVYQMNIIRTILQGDSTNTLDSDHFALQIRGNINKE